MKSSLVTLGLAALLSGCASAPDRFFTLLPAAQSGDTSMTTTKVEYLVVVGPITVPAMLDQGKMVVTKPGNQVDIREKERWASPLKEELATAVATRLGRLLPQASVAAFHQSASMRAKTRVSIDFSRFELGPGRQTSIDAFWFIKQDNKDAELRGRTKLSTSAATSGYADLATAQGEGLEKLAKAIAEALSTTSP